MRTISTLFILLTAFISLSPIGFEEALTARVEEVLERGNSLCTYEYVGDGWFEFTTPEGRTFREYVPQDAAYKVSAPPKTITFHIPSIDTTGFSQIFKKVGEVPLGTDSRAPFGYAFNNGKRCLFSGQFISGYYTGTHVYEADSGRYSFTKIHTDSGRGHIVASVGPVYNDNLPHLVGEAGGGIVVIYQKPQTSYLPVEYLTEREFYNPEIQFVRTFDFDDDGLLEIISDSDSVIVSKYISSNNSLRTIHEPLSIKHLVGSYAVGDFDGDRIGEFGTVRMGGEAVFVEYTDSGFQVRQRESTLGPNGGFNIEGNDIDQDGKMEVFLGSAFFGGLLNISVFEAEANDQYIDKVWLQITGIGALTRRICTGDFNGDGTDELCIAYGGIVIVLDATSDDTYELLWYNTFPGETSVSSFDCNGDGQDELLVGRFIGDNSVSEIFTLNKDVVSVPSPAPGTFEVHSVYPQPAASSTTVSFIPERTGRCSISLYDINGRVVYTKSFHAASAAQHNERIETGSLRSGVYYYVLENGSTSATGKLLKVR